MKAANEMQGLPFSLGEISSGNGEIRDFGPGMMIFTHLGRPWGHILLLLDRMRLLREFYLVQGPPRAEPVGFPRPVGACRDALSPHRCGSLYEAGSECLSWGNPGVGCRNM